ncbi:GNAT family N-acetyltransferase [Halomicrobium urmianum]|uniref:GNAT family N-acetyltransferase n=1 Tax=Halomicrobium urmianum TaxID=1586233 RepID=UPI001CD9C7C3|nr:GNAT family protein [Halomicrobium urmianum]
MPPGAFLRGDAVTLHPVDEDDLPFLRDLMNEPRVRESVGSYRPFTTADEREWYEGLDEADLSFVVRADGDRVGTVGLVLDDHPWGLAELGYSIHPDHWDCGYATDAARAVVRHGFEERRLNKVVADAFATNEGSQRVLEKVGFEQEGRRRSHAFVDGEYVDLLEFGLLVDEWRK